MKADDIHSKQSFEEYFDKFDDSQLRMRAAEKFAYMSAVRIAPYSLNYFASHPYQGGTQWTPLPIFAALVQLSFCLLGKDYASQAVDRAINDLLYAWGDESGYVDTFADRSVTSINFASDAFVSNYSMQYRTEAAVTSVDYCGSVLPVDYWDTVRSDAAYIENSKSIGSLPVWRNRPPSWFMNIWMNVIRQFEVSSNADWSFWTAWYQRALLGQDLKSAAIAEIFDQFSKDDWLGDPAKVNPAFDPILELYRQDEAGGGGDFDPMPKRKPANFKAIRSQVVALKDYLDAEFDFLRSQNDIAQSDAPERDAILEVLAELRAIIDDILATFDEGNDDTKTVEDVEAKLPAVVEKAGELAELQGTPDLAGPIVTMTANVKYLTDYGWPGHIAVGAAAGDLGLKLGTKFVKSGWKYVAGDGAKEPPALTRFPPNGDDQ